MLLSNTATTTMVLASIMPLLKSLDKNSGVAKALLLGIPVASTAGGMATIIGTPANAIAVGALQKAGITIEFLDWMIYGLPIAIVLTAVSCFALIKKYIKDTTPISTAFLDDLQSDISRNHPTAKYCNRGNSCYHWIMGDHLIAWYKSGISVCCSSCCAYTNRCA